MKRAEADKTSVLETIGKIREFRQGVAPAGASIREMIEEGGPPLRRAARGVLTLIGRGVNVPRLLGFKDLLEGWPRIHGS